MLDLASRYRETCLFNIWRMGMNSIEKGSQDHWTVTPKRIAALEAAAAQRGGAAADAADAAVAERRAGAALRPAATSAGGGFGGTARISDGSLQHGPARSQDCAIRAATSFPSDQADFATATEFVNALLKNGITVHKATAAFTVAGKNYPAGSYVVKTAQAFRPHVMDMFEPQDHPNDFAYPGGPPIPPYDITGWTLAHADGREVRSHPATASTAPSPRSTACCRRPPASIIGPAEPGRLSDQPPHQQFVHADQSPAEGGCRVLLAENDSAGRWRRIWAPAPSGCPPRRPRAPCSSSVAKELGVPVACAWPKRPAGDALKLKPIRIGLYDQYGGFMPPVGRAGSSSSTNFRSRWSIPQTLDAGDLKDRFDVLVFPGVAPPDAAQPAPDTIPEKYRTWLGHITQEKTLPQLRKFIEAGGAIVSVGRSSTRMADWLDIPVEKYITAPRDKYYIPGSLLKVNVDNNNPLAYGMPEEAIVFFDNSPVFKLRPDAPLRGVSAVAWFTGAKPLVSGWAWGQQYLDGGTAVAEASLGRGKLFLLGPEVTFRGQSHGTFKLLFNALYAGSAEAAAIP